MRTLRRNWDLVVALGAAALLSACFPWMAVHFLSKEPTKPEDGKSTSTAPSVRPPEGNERKVLKVADGVRKE